MKILIAAFTTALLVFTLATTWTDMIQPRIDVLTAATSTKNVDVSSNSKLSPNKRSTTDTNDELDSDDDSPRNANKSRRGALGKSDLNSNRIRDELERAKQQELKLAAREETLRILFDDIRTEMAVVDEIRRRTSTDLSLAARRVSETVVSNSTMDAVPTDESVTWPQHKVPNQPDKVRPNACLSWSNDSQIQRREASGSQPLFSAGSKNVKPRRFYQL